MATKLKKLFIKFKTLKFARTFLVEILAAFSLIVVF